eukprot:CAMPEP_0174730918 /NCGR_PEP_ID=MMETSP1094-20130205/56510_1 /TAXON_ID=156173 /ORGANISM="Chrysochromulina brevifilum, Strain UTEX LB 985" /LENGTH=85 /DNA_ID=CAMNT_0015933237 /DNA_START=537 /DNA_END=794 /DNA_ORIENTATION=+
MAVVINAPLRVLAIATSTHAPCAQDRIRRALDIMPVQVVEAMAKHVVTLRVVMVNRACEGTRPPDIEIAEICAVTIALLQMETLH